MSSDSKTTSSDQPRPEAPIDVLPVEIILEIFTLGSNSSGNTSFSFLVSTICQSWRSLAIGEPRLWTNLTLTTTTTVEPLPIPTDSPFLVSLVFPREALIVELSADTEIDICIGHKYPEEYETERYPLTEDHFFVLSHLLVDQAHRIRSLRVTTLDWPEIYHLCTKLRGIPMPRLETYYLKALCSEVTVRMVDYGEPTQPVQLLEYAQDDDALPMTSHDLRICSGLLYPALKDVCCSGIPMDWGRFCASNLRVLSLQNQPLEARPSMEILRGIISNSKHTLESELGDPPPSESRMTLPHVKHLKLLYIDPREAQHILRAFDFPTLRKLIIKSHDKDEDSSAVLVDVLKYIRVEELFDVMLAGISLPPEDFPEQTLNGAAAESLPLLLQFLRRLTRGDLFQLVLEYCCDDFLKFMNYGNEFGGGKLNLSGLNILIVKGDTEDSSARVMSFIRDRLELGTVDGVYVGPAMEHLIIIVKPNVEEEAESLGDLKLAKDLRFFFCNVVLMN
ncbi:uncharacterized protein ARMOST_02451 [Armillaria ostoyae]|uniref:Uncharacterized protein n=1 Tax=Armillaria ostoyae TaxID=47428 RepID=A0A284QRX7_ARMOS|nr:uncharacterized protein ARMOST_02451 [Armillaria ostoyae]